MKFVGSRAGVKRKKVFKGVENGHSCIIFVVMVRISNIFGHDLKDSL